MNTPPVARARLIAMFNLSERDEVEFGARVDAVVAAETATLQARVAELSKQRDADQAERSRWWDAESIVERARDKGCDQIDTDVLVEAFGLDQP